MAGKKSVVSLEFLSSRNVTRQRKIRLVRIWVWAGKNRFVPNDFFLTRSVYIVVLPNIGIFRNHESLSYASLFVIFLGLKHHLILSKLHQGGEK